MKQMRKKWLKQKADLGEQSSQVSIPYYDAVAYAERLLKRKKVVISSVISISLLLFVGLVLDPSPFQSVALWIGLISVLLVGIFFSIITIATNLTGDTLLYLDERQDVQSIVIFLQKGRYTQKDLKTIIALAEIGTHGLQHRFAFPSILIAGVVAAFAIRAISDSPWIGWVLFALVIVSIFSLISLSGSAIANTNVQKAAVAFHHMEEQRQEEERRQLLQDMLIEQSQTPTTPIATPVTPQVPTAQKDLPKPPRPKA